MAVRQSWVKAQADQGTNRIWGKTEKTVHFSWKSLVIKCQGSCRSVGMMTCMHDLQMLDASLSLSIAILSSEMLDAHCPYYDIVFSRATKTLNSAMRSRNLLAVLLFLSQLDLPSEHNDFVARLHRRFLIYSMACHCIVPQSTPHSHPSLSSGWSMQWLWEPLTWYAHGWMGWKGIWCALAGPFGDIWMLHIWDM